MAKHRRATRHLRVVSTVSEADLTRISTDLIESRPTAPPDRVEAAIHDAAHILAGLVTAPHHVITLIRTRAEAMLNVTHPANQVGGVPEIAAPRTPTDVPLTGQVPTPRRARPSDG